MTHWHMVSVRTRSGQVRSSSQSAILSYSRVRTPRVYSESQTAQSDQVGSSQLSLQTFQVLQRLQPLLLMLVMLLLVVQSILLLPPLLVLPQPVEVVVLAEEVDWRVELPGALAGQRGPGHPAAECALVENGAVVAEEAADGAGHRCQHADRRVINRQQRPADFRFWSERCSEGANL